MLKDIFTKEVMANAVVTLAVVMVGLAVHDKFVKPMMSSSAPITPAPSPSPAPAVEEEA